MHFIPVSQELVSDGLAKPTETEYLFIAVRNCVQGSFGKVVTFDKSTRNVGEVLNMDTGVFTSPSKGAYMFKALALNGMYLQVNGVKIEWNEDEEIPYREHEAIHIARVTLNTGDRVTLFNYLQIDPVINYNQRNTEFQGFRLNHKT